MGGHVQAETDAGVLRGAVAPDGVASFLGVRYAAPPVGAGRFRPPRPETPWTGVRDALEFGPAAMQPPSPLVDRGLELSEDCLTLNVWVPPEASAAAVMVWFHGGGFTTGASSIPWYHGAALARRGVVVVTVNYRLGPLGFLHLEALGGEGWAGAANLGLSDQALALDWVQRNIASFGGDPGRVTIFGESAGAMSVSVQLAFPTAKGTFHRAIAQSGSATHVHESGGAEQVATAVLEGLGLDGRSLERLRDLPAQAFIDVQASVAEPQGGGLGLPFRPTVDGTTLPHAPIDHLGAVPLMTGTTLEEMRLFVAMARLVGGGRPLDEDRLLRRIGRMQAAIGRNSPEPAEVAALYRERLGPDATPDDVFIAVSTDLTFRMPAIEMVEAHPGDDTWMYLFTHESSAFEGLLGSAHAVEIPFAFENLHQRGPAFLVGDVTEERLRLADAMAGAWVAFATEGDPSTPSLGEWPRYDRVSRSTMLLDTACRVVDDPQGEERLVWRG